MLSILRLPLKPLAHLMQLGNGLRDARRIPRIEDAIPISGINRDAAHSILFNLKEALNLTDSESDLADLWLESYCLCQLASSSLITQLRQVDETLRFWRERNREGASVFFLIRRGPVHFFRGLIAPLCNLLGVQPFGRRLPAHERMERRIVVLQRLRSKLLQSLALVHGRAAHLLVNAPALAIASLPEPAAAGPRDRWNRAVRTVVHVNRSNGRAAGRVVRAPSPLSAAAPREGTDTEPEDPTGEDGPQQVDAVQSRASSPPGTPHARMSSGAAEVIGAARHLIKARAIVREATRAVEQCCAALAIDLEGLHKDVQQILQSHEQEVNAFATGSATPAVGNHHSSSSNTGGGGGGAFSSATEGASTAAAAEAVERLRRALNAEYRAAGKKNAFAALNEAHAGVRRARLDLPAWLRMPSKLQQKWVECLVGAGFAVGVGKFFWKHSRLSGSTDLEDWTNAATKTVKAQWKERVLEPLAVIRGELFSTFRKRDSIVTDDDLALSKLSLLRMLKEFEADHAKKTGRTLPPPAAAALTVRLAPSSVHIEDESVSGSLVDSLVSMLPESLGGAPAAAADAPTPATTRSLPEGMTDEELLRRMALLMSVYETELRHPLRNALGGNLARAMLIQVQKLKVDTEAAMLELEKILRANELTIAVTAALPAFLVLGAFGGLVLRMLLPGARKPVQGSGLAIACRLSLSDLEKSIEATSMPRDGGLASVPGLYLPASTSLSGRSDGGRRALNESAEALEAGGLVLYRVAMLRAHLERVYRGFHRLAVTHEMREEFGSIESDLNDLIQRAGAEQRRRIVERMSRTYTVFLPAS